MGQDTEVVLRTVHKDDASKSIAAGQRDIRDELERTEQAARELAQSEQAGTREAREELDLLLLSYRELAVAAARSGEVQEGAVLELDQRLEAAERQARSLREELERLARTPRQPQQGPVGPDPATQFTAEAAAAVEARFGRAFAVVGEGAKGAGTEVFKAIRAVAAFEEVLEAVRRSGSPVPPQALADLEAMRAKLRQLEVEYARLEAQREDFRDNTAARKTALAGEIGSINDLTDVLRLGGAKWADYGAQAFAAVGVFNLAYDLTRKTAEALNALGKELGFGSRSFDELIQRVTGMQPALEAVLGLFGNSASAAEVYGLQLRTLTSLGVEHAAGTEGVALAYEALVKRQKEAFLAARDQEGAVTELRAQLLALKGATEVEKDIDRLTKGWQAFLRTGEDASQIERFLPGFTAEADRAARAADLLGDRVDNGAGAALARLLPALRDLSGEGELKRLGLAIQDVEAKSAQLGGTLGEGVQAKLDLVGESARKVLAGGHIGNLRQEILDAHDAINAALGTLDPAKAKALDELRSKLQASAGDFSQLGVATAQGVRDALAQVERFVEGIGGIGAATEEQARVVAGRLGAIREQLKDLPAETVELLAEDLAGLEPTLQAARDQAAGLREEINSAAPVFGRFAVGVDTAGEAAARADDNFIRLGGSSKEAAASLGPVATFAGAAGVALAGAAGETVRLADAQDLMVVANERGVVALNKQTEAVLVLSAAQHKLFGLQLPEDIARSTAAEGEYIRAVEEGGKVNAQQADAIVARAEAQLAAIAKLPAAEQAALEGTKQVNEARIALYEGATSKIKQQVQELTDALLQETEDVLSRLKDRQAEIDGRALADRAGQEAELALLRARENKGDLLSQEDVERIAELENAAKDAALAIGGLEKPLRQFGDASKEAALTAEEANESLNIIADTIGGLPGLYTALSDAQRAAITNILDGARANGEAALLDAATYRNTVDGVADVLESAGFETQQFREQLGLAGDTAAQLGKKLGDFEAGLAPGWKAMKRFGDIGVESFDGVARSGRRAASAIDGAAAATSRLVTLTEALGKVKL